MRAIRLWWRCTLCRWKVDTFGYDHTDSADLLALGWDARVLRHLYRKHKLDLGTATATAARFEPAGRTSRCVRKTVIVEPDA